MDSPSTSPESAQIKAPETTAVPIDQLREPPPDKAAESKEAPKPEAKDESRQELMAQVREKIKLRFKDRDRSTKPEDKEKKPESDPADNGTKSKPEKEEKPKEEKKAPEKKETKKKEEPGDEEEARPTGHDELAKAVAESTAATRAALDLVNRREKEQKQVDKAATQKSPLEAKMERLPEKYREDVPILKAMEERYPDKYRGIADKYLDAASKTVKYAEQWEKENPGQPFDATSEEHNEFFRKNEVTWDDRDYQRAVAKLEMQPELEKERKETQAKLKEMEAKTTISEIEPVIRQQQGAVARATLKEIKPEYEDIVAPNGYLNEEAFNKLREENRFVADALMSELSPLAVFIREAEKLYHPSDLFAYDDRNPTHVEIGNFALAQEKRIKSMPLEKQRDREGRLFASSREFYELPEQERGDRWVLSKGQVVELRRRETAAKLKQVVDDLEKSLEKAAKARGFVKGDVSKSASQGESKETKESKPSSPKVESPSATPEPKTDTLQNPTAGQPSDFRSLLKARLRATTVK